MAPWAGLVDKRLACNVESPKSRLMTEVKQHRSLVILQCMAASLIWVMQAWV